jgi:hypothetical protein
MRPDRREERLLHKVFGHLGMSHPQERVPVKKIAVLVHPAIRIDAPW